MVLYCCVAVQIDPAEPIATVVLTICDIKFPSLGVYYTHNYLLTCIYEALETEDTQTIAM